MIALLLVATLCESLAENSLEAARLSVGHGDARHNAPLLRLATHTRHIHPSDQSNDCVSHFDFPAWDKQASNYFGLCQGREMLAQAFYSVSAECLNPVMHSCLSNFGEALRSFNPRVFVSEAIRLTDLFKIDSDATAVST